MLRLILHSSILEGWVRIEYEEIHVNGVEASWSLGTGYDLFHTVNDGRGHGDSDSQVERELKKLPMEIDVHNQFIPTYAFIPTHYSDSLLTIFY